MRADATFPRLENKDCFKLLPECEGKLMAPYHKTTTVLYQWGEKIDYVSARRSRAFLCNFFVPRRFLCALRSTLTEHNRGLLQFTIYGSLTG